MIILSSHLFCSSRRNIQDSEHAQKTFCSLIGFEAQAPVFIDLSAKCCSAIYFLQDGAV